MGGRDHLPMRAPAPAFTKTVTPQPAAVLFEESQLYDGRLYQFPPPPPPAANAMPYQQSQPRTESSVQRDSVSRAMPSGRRFVAGEAFFNYEAFGSLRPEFPAIDLFSTAFLGLAVNGFAAGFVTELLKNGFRQLLGEFLTLDDPSYAKSIVDLLDWAGVFSVVLGFLSDCRPIGKRRRKPYMIIGWLIAGVLFTVTATVDLLAAKSWDVLKWDPNAPPGASTIEGTHGASTYGIVMLLLSIGATLALQLMYIASLSMTVEFAQRETLHERGKLQATYFVVNYVGAAVAQAVTTLFVHGDLLGHFRSQLPLSAVAGILAAMCFLPVPFLVAYLDEPSIRGTTVHFSVRRRVHELWRFCHQNVVNRILAFVFVHYFFVHMYSQNGRKAVAVWCGITPNRLPTVNAIDSAGLCLALILWISFMVNWSWRRIAAAGSAYYILGYVALTTIIVYDVERSTWFYILSQTTFDLPRALLKLYALVFSTEIADNGREGVTMGLVYALQAMIEIIVRMMSENLASWLNMEVTMKEVVADSSHTRNAVFTSSMVAFGINLVCLLVVLVLPSQKLDAQQLRAFGGYNRYASYCTLFIFTIGFIVIFVFNTSSLFKHVYY